jgi:hypothetical protein
MLTQYFEIFGNRVISHFTGKIAKVTVDLKEMKAADKAEEEKARAGAAHKKALAD